MWTSLVLFALTGAASNVEVRPLDGPPVVGVLASLDDGKLVVAGPQGDVSWELAKLADVRNLAAAAAADVPIRIETIDGSQIAASQFTAASGKAKVVTPAETFSLNTEDIVAVRFQPQSETLAAAWRKLLGTSGSGDCLVLRKGETLDLAKGVLREVGEDSVKFELDGETLTVKRAKLHGLGYHRVADRKTPEAAGVVFDAFGSVWNAKSLSLQGDALTWTTPTGLKVSRPLRNVSRIDYSRGKILYLSDAAPETTRWAPFVGKANVPPARASWFEPRSNQGPGGVPLMLDGRKFSNGLSIHSKTTLTYRVPEGFRRFQAVAGIADRVRPLGNVRLVVQGDERVLFEGAIAGTESARNLDLDVKNVRRLTILVDFGAEGDVGDQLNLGDARLIR